MKKSIFAVVAVLAAVLACGLVSMGCVLFAAAGKTPDVPPPDLGVYDQSVPEDQLVTLEIAGGLKVTGFNGKEVSWGENGTGTGENTLSSNAWRAMRWGNKFKTIIKIPAGNNTLQANLYLWDYNEMPGTVRGAAYIRANGLGISHDFQAGQTYFLRPILIVKNTFGKEEYEMIDYNNSGPVGFFQGVYLRIDGNGTPVAKGNRISP